MHQRMTGQANKNFIQLHARPFNLYSFLCCNFLFPGPKKKQESKKHASARRKNEMCGDGDDFPPAVDRIWYAIKMKIAVHCTVFFTLFG